MTDQEIFKGCKRVARGLDVIRKKRIKVLKRFDDSVSSRTEIFQTKIRANLMAQFTEREKQFLELNILDQKLFDYLIECFDIQQSEIPGKYNFMIHSLTVLLTGTEINNHGFYFDTGRDEIRRIVNSIFCEKLGVSLTPLAFDYGGDHILFFYSQTDTHYDASF